MNQRNLTSNRPAVMGHQADTLPQPGSTAQKFGNLRTVASEIGLGSHEGKYTPSSSVPNLATRSVILSNLKTRL